jgi:hypothetical protein
MEWINHANTAVILPVIAISCQEFTATADLDCVYYHGISVRQRPPAFREHLRRSAVRAKRGVIVDWQTRLRSPNAIHFAERKTKDEQEDRRQRKQTEACEGRID